MKKSESDSPDLKPEVSDGEWKEMTEQGLDDRDPPSLSELLQKKEEADLLQRMEKGWTLDDSFPDSEWTLEDLREDKPEEQGEPDDLKFLRGFQIVDDHIVPFFPKEEELPKPKG